MRGELHDLPLPVLAFSEQLSLPNIRSDAKATKSRLISIEMRQVCAVLEGANILGLARSSGHFGFEAAK